MTDTDYVNAARIVYGWRLEAREHPESPRFADAIENAFIRFFTNDNPAFDAASFTALADPATVAH